MVGKRKHFSATLYDQYDDPAKLAVAQYMGGRGFERIVWDPEGQYGIDLYCFDPEKNLTAWVEVECRPWCWTPEGWQYPTVHMLERKRKMIRKDFYLAALDQDFKRAVFVPVGPIVTAIKAGPVAVRNREVADGELFYDVEFDPKWVRSLI